MLSKVIHKLNMLNKQLNFTPPIIQTNTEQSFTCDNRNGPWENSNVFLGK